MYTHSWQHTYPRTYLAEENVKNVKDEEQRELGSEEREEPLRRVHVSLKTQLNKVIPQITQLILYQQNNTSRTLYTGTMIICGTYSSKTNIKCELWRYAHPPAGVALIDRTWGADLQIRI